MIILYHHILSIISSKFSRMLIVKLVLLGKVYIFYLKVNGITRNKEE
uniref:Uncharacterized protein n=1 Tax=Phyllymenia taiwanensis TaxID=1260292 RepID=R9XYQ1_9FLOR|nr:hypothetical protein [Grateloupia taiwanensis]AGO19801.1 hypothetical protein [Grateloupia taiwanensis]